MKTDKEPRVFFSSFETKCKGKGCPKRIEKGDFVVLTEGNVPLCPACAKIAHLVYLKSGDPALTRRAAKHSKLSFEVKKYSEVRERSERQGILVQPKALEKAKRECEADKDIRDQRKEKARERKAVISYLTANSEI